MVNPNGLNEQDGLSQIPRISEVLFEQRERSFASLAPMPCNVEAIEAGLLFGTGANPFVAIVGPSGWGKSHLLGAVLCRLGQERGANPEFLPVRTYLAGGGKADSTHLILDDVQDVLDKPRQRQELRFALERRVKAAKPAILAFTVPKPNRQLKAFLPSPRDWTLATMGEPHPAERVLLLNQMGASEGMMLSPRLIKILAHQMHGSARTFSGALKKLRLAGDRWLDGEESLRALGVLDACFVDNGAWDLKLKILKIAEQAQAQFARVSHVDLALHVMLHTAGLAEAEVARAADIAPAVAYHRAGRFGKLAESCETTAAYVPKFVELVISSLAQE